MTRRLLAAFLLPLLWLAPSTPTFALRVPQDLEGRQLIEADLEEPPAAPFVRRGPHVLLRDEKVGDVSQDYPLKHGRHYARFTIPWLRAQMKRHLGFGRAPAIELPGMDQVVGKPVHLWRAAASFDQGSWRPFLGGPYVAYYLDPRSGANGDRYGLLGRAGLPPVERWPSPRTWQADSCSTVISATTRGGSENRLIGPGNRAVPLRHKGIARDSLFLALPLPDEITEFGEHHEGNGEPLAVAGDAGGPEVSRMTQLGSVAMFPLSLLAARRQEISRAEDPLEASSCRSEGIPRDRHQENPRPPVNNLNLGCRGRGAAVHLGVRHHHDLLVHVVYLGVWHRCCFFEGHLLK